MTETDLGDRGDLGDLDTVIAPILADAGAIALRWFRSAVATEDKHAGTDRGFDPVTEADRSIEDLMRARLTERFPDHQITGEERGTTGAPGRYRWLLDPIDGTKAFVSGSPLWGIMAGLLDDGRPVAGWINQPYIGETFAAVDGEATLTRGDDRRPLRSRQDSELDDAVLYTMSPHWVPGRQQAIYDALAGAVRLVRFGGDCYSYCQLALGYVDIVIEPILNAHDIVPVIPIVEAAGGVVTGLDGQDPAEGGFALAAANPRVHDQALALIDAL